MSSCVCGGECKSNLAITKIKSYLIYIRRKYYICNKTEGREIRSKVSQKCILGIEGNILLTDCQILAIPINTWKKRELVHTLYSISVETARCWLKAVRDWLLGLKAVCMYFIYRVRIKSPTPPPKSIFCGIQISVV